MPLVYLACNSRIYGRHVLNCMVKLGVHIRCVLKVKGMKVSHRSYTLLGDVHEIRQLLLIWPKIMAIY